MKAKKKKEPTNRWSRSTEKEQYWRNHVQAWLASGLSIRAYCQRQGVIETSFYAWRRELNIRDREHGKKAMEVGTVRDRRGRFIPTQFREDVHPLGGSDGNDCGNVTPFVRLSVVDDNSSAVIAAVPTDTSSLGLTITTPNGYSISLSQVSDIDQLAAVLEKVGGRTC